MISYRISTDRAAICVSRPSQFGVDSASHLNGDATDATNLFLFALGSADEIIDENRAKACAASSKTVEFEQGGEMHTAAVVAVAQDGSALKRDYGHCYTGSAAAAFAVDKETGLVVDKGISQASCHYCVRACNARLRERREAGNPMTPSELKNMSKDEMLALHDHDGFCYRNSSYSPGVAEEHLAENVGS